MIRRKTFFIALPIVIVIGIVAWWLGSPLFINNAVDEAFPFDMPDASELADMSEAELLEVEAEFEAAVPDAEKLEQLSPEDEAKVEEMVLEAAASVMLEKDVEEPMPEGPAEWTLIRQGKFVGSDSFHQGSGNVGVYQQGDRFVVRFENFSVTNGPALHVILTKHPSPYLHDAVGDDYVDLGTLKGNLGDQNYELPPDIFLSDFQSVVIYCVPFRAVFATATLN